MSNVTQHHSEFQSGAGHISQMSNLKEKNPKSNPEPYKVRGCPVPFIVVQGKIQLRTTKEFSEIQHPLVVLGWVAQYPLVVLGKIPTPTLILPLQRRGRK